MDVLLPKEALNYSVSMSRCQASQVNKLGAGLGWSLKG
jgi:hypothetical protein